MAKEPNIGTNLDEAEKQVIEALESDDVVFVSRLTPKRKKEIQALARAAMNPAREKITLRIAQYDLMQLKAKAMNEDMPYQTVIGSILHRAVS